MRTLNIAISPCPNDTFIFENLYSGKITIPDVQLRFHFLDIEQLNNAALCNKYDVIKVSYALLPKISETYIPLRSGGAMGFGVGPLLVCAAHTPAGNIKLPSASVAIPGVHTTANFLLSYLYPAITSLQKQAMLFSDVEAAILSGDAQFGVLIHEGRFTYAQRGLQLVADLGTLWHAQEKLPIPLGCIVVRAGMDLALQHSTQEAIAGSISNYDAQGNAIISEFIKYHAQEMSPAVMQQHIDLYVNAYSKDIGHDGEIAIAKMMAVLATQV